MIKYILICLLISNVFAIEVDQIYKEQLEGKNVELVWIEDSRLPIYNLSLYFADGGLSDQKGHEGETEALFSLLFSGTNRYGQKEISDALEFYGASISHNMTHEYSVINVSGLAKDIIPTIKMICHCFSDAQYPTEEVKKYIDLQTNGLQNMVTNHSRLADHIFRTISMDQTPFSSPTNGTIKSLKNLNSKKIKEKLSYFKKNVKKTIYITGPKEVKDIYSLVIDACGFDAKKSNFSREVTYKNPITIKGPNIILAKVPNANQAQVRVGRFLPQSLISNPELMALSSTYLGGGFTSKLMQELRVKRGLTYSVGSFAGTQKYYGRSGISTFTKNETVADLLNVIKSTLEEIGNGALTNEELIKSQNYLSGNYLFGFEESAAFLQSIMSFDHSNRSIDNLIKFPTIIKSFKKEEVVASVKELFNWNDMTIVVVGDAKLAPLLKKIGQVREVQYKDFL